MERGDLVFFPAGPAGAHKVINRGDSPARTLMFSSSQTPAISVYPDTDRICVWTGNEADDLVFKRGHGSPVVDRGLAMTNAAWRRLPANVHL